MSDTENKPETPALDGATHAKVPLAQWNQIQQVLLSLPYGQVANLIGELNEQVKPHKE